MIAVVDDDARVLESLENLLHSVRYSGWLFCCPKDFLKSDTPYRADCRISDIGLSHLDGFELQGLAQAMRPECPRKGR